MNTQEPKNVVDIMYDIERMIQNPSDNFVTSPVTLYYSLLVLAQITAGKAHEDIISLLHVDDEHLVEMTNLLYSAFNSDKDCKVQLDSSLWINQSFDLKYDYLDMLKNQIHSLVAPVDMGNEATDQAIQTWVNDHTGHLLEDAVKNIQTDALTFFELFATLYYKSGWKNEFDIDDSYEGDFFVNDDHTVTCTYMNNESAGRYVACDHFKGATKSLSGGYEMALILPEEHMSLEAVLDDERVYAFMKGTTGEEAYVDLTLPRFEVGTNDDLMIKFKQMGLSSLTDDLVDFSPVIVDTSETLISKASQSTRLIVNEEGVEGASYVEIAAVRGAAFHMLTTYKLTLDRPFIFAVTKRGLPLFVGNILNPVE